MPIVSRDGRQAALRMLSPGLMKLCIGELQHRQLAYRCRVEPLSVYSNGDTGGVVPAVWDNATAPNIVPLWECETTIVARRSEEFVEFDVESPEELVVLARSERGLLAYLFFYLVEDLGGAALLRATPDESHVWLVDLATTIGFDRVEEVMDLQEKIGAEPNCAESVLAFARSY